MAGTKMALRRVRAVRWAPNGLSDALDGTEDFQGACSLLTNLIPAQNNNGMVIARPAAVRVATLPDYGGGPMTALLTVGNMAYGMYESLSLSQNPDNWDPARINADIALSEGNLTATHTGGVSRDGIAPAIN